MGIIYEINPPKIPNDSITKEERDSLLSKLLEKVSEINTFCDGIHVTDSVLGTKRISALSAGKLLKENYPNLQITISMRVRDKNMTMIKQSVQESIDLKLDGVLVLKGDPSKENPVDSGLIPSLVVKQLMDLGYGKKTNFFLSLPSNPNFDKIQKKIDAAPQGFMTQVIHSAEQVQRISEKLRPKGFRIIPCILLPTEKNENSAKFLQLDWSGYKEDPAEFIRQIHSISGDVLITSPSDFTFAKETLKKI
ncbi:5 10-methylenetetrahydrofolate reductase-like protein [Candidatus Nitrosarchaeum limnium SFB1]|jgi:homocysteine S-methyltransferase|uniref:5 10-methylenetetrahydrofolate reductase-like protein n=1 Tax=Candidatus Nitrosarchaeum limnium SFB1 TaxID=886738 RepID=F3KKJ3_9ARCH|nr:5 10-methylenetetrahydrofolate reductase-like protein [Candidatus Nitrosarchaeum limnium SFB1]